MVITIIATLAPPLCQAPCGSDYANWVQVGPPVHSEQEFRLASQTGPRRCFLTPGVLKSRGPEQVGSGSASSNAHGDGKLELVLPVIGGKCFRNSDCHPRMLRCGYALDTKAGAALYTMHLSSLTTV